MVLLASDFDKSKYLRAEDLKAEKRFRIKAVTVEAIGAGIEKEQKLVVWFTNDERGLVLNKTNNRTLRGAFGDEVNGWKDKIVIIFPTTVDMRGKMTPALRVRIPPPKQATAPGNGQVAVSPPPQPAPPSTQELLDEFGQTQSPEKPSLSDDLNDEIGF